MAFLSWIKNRVKAKAAREPEDEPSPDRYVTKRGNPIKVIEQGKWHSDHPGYESKTLIGRSIEGHHGGREVSYGGGDGPVVWSNARSTREGAEKASCGISGPDEYQGAQRRDRDLKRGARRNATEPNTNPERDNPKTKPRPRPSWER